jgi:uncharacterized protein YneF (UPF0154 family)
MVIGNGDNPRVAGKTVRAVINKQGNKQTEVVQIRLRKCPFLTCNS